MRRGRSIGIAAVVMGWLCACCGMAGAATNISAEIPAGASVYTREFDASGPNTWVGDKLDVTMSGPGGVFQPGDYDVTLTMPGGFALRAVAGTSMIASVHFGSRTPGHWADAAIAGVGTLALTGSNVPAASGLRYDFYYNGDNPSVDGQYSATNQDPIAVAVDPMDVTSLHFTFTVPVLPTTPPITLDTFWLQFEASRSVPNAEVPGYPPLVAVHPIPEPATLGALALTGFCLARRRGRRTRD